MTELGLDDEDEYRLSNPGTGRLRNVDQESMAVISGNNDESRPLSGDTIKSHPEDLRNQLKSPHFFSMTGIPKFGKNWLDNFIPDEEMQNTFLTSEVVRNVIMIQCVYFTSIYSDILRSYRLLLNETAANQHSSRLSKPIL